MCISPVLVDNCRYIHNSDRLTPEIFAESDELADALLLSLLNNELVYIDGQGYIRLTEYGIDAINTEPTDDIPF